MDADALLAELADAARALMDENGTPGVALGVLVDGQVRTLGLGVTQRAHALPVDGGTVFQVASISKLFVALAAQRLAEQGVVDLDSPVRRWLPGLELDDPSVAERVTLRHLLTHQAGFEGDFVADTGRGDDALERMLPWLRDAPQRTPLGEPHYSNLGFVLAGLVLSTATGTPFEQVVVEQVIEPLGLERTHYFIDRLAYERIAAAHAKEGPVPGQRPRARAPNGGVLSCAQDLLAFARFHLGDGTAPDGQRLLTPDSLAALLRAQGPGASLCDALGIAWNLTDTGGVALAGHDGSSPGFRSDLWLAPAHGAAFVHLGNSDEARTNIVRVTERFVRALGGDPQPPVAAGEPPADLDRRYFSRFAGLIRIGEGRLQWWGEEPEPRESRLVTTGRDRFELLDDPLRGVRADLIRDASGAIEWLRIHGRLLRPYADGDPIPELDALIAERRAVS